LKGFKNMKKELEMELVKKYPKLYSQYGGDMRQTCMAWGMSCGDGWYNIIDELSAKLEPFGIVAAQVKEKFGGLRFYIEATPAEHFEEVHKLIQEAEVKSFETCEECGKPGERRGGGWIKTLCDECDKKD
jgi:hypothetical protein